MTQMAGTPSPAVRLEAFGRLLEGLEGEIGRRMVGQRKVVRSVVSGFLAGGHILLEGVPGLGKTLLVRTLAECLELTFSRIQFTPDLMPADVIGTQLVVEESTGGKGFRFQPGPVFGQVVLADEINRATPKTQSALLEAMEEGAITVGRRRYGLREPFCVLATQNPIEMEGTYPLPEAQLDRFLLKVTVPYPDLDELRQIGRQTTQGELPTVRCVADPGEIGEARMLVRGVVVSPHVEEYAARLVLATHPEQPSAPEPIRRAVRFGASPRGLQALLLAGKVRALAAGRVHLAADDVRSVAREALAHRLVLSLEGESRGVSGEGLVEELLVGVPVDG